MAFRNDIVLEVRMLVSVLFRRISTTQRVNTLDVSEEDKPVRCWNCHHLHTDQFFCPACTSVQCIKCSTKKLNHFQVMKNEVTFDVNLPSVKQHYLKLQTELHPDRFASRSKTERDYSNTQSALINRAYKTLSDPLKRGLYILGLHGYDLNPEQTETSSSDLLNEIFMMNFKVDECEDKAGLLEIQTQVIKSIDEDLADISEKFQQQQYEMARLALIRLKYRTNIKIKVEDKLFTIG